ncbi:MAG: hypothetical protein NTU57_05125 [Candidatus Aenigmarchaeota archaeon]|nr:hypothetical protein [Candidatus Aenigmarchaeota archaeon]
MTEISERDFNPEKHVQEYKRKCNQCGKVWHSLVSREKQIEKQNKCDACVQGSSACGGDLQTATQSQRNREAKEMTLQDLKKCPQCGSANYSEEIITYEKK